MPKYKKNGKNLISKEENVHVYSPYFDRHQNVPKYERESFGCKAVMNVPSMRIQSIQNKKKYDFFNQECLVLAKALLGQLIVHQVNGKRLSGFVTETECYIGIDDVASHSYKGKQTPRNEPMFMQPGTTYVYFIYGMYYCFNISSKGAGSCVLIRALEPHEGLEEMQINRQSRKSEFKKLKNNHLCNGPSKLCQALNIKKETCNKINMLESRTFWIEDGMSVCEEDVVISKRIGIKSAGEEWANKPLRFYILGNSCVSVRDKKAEELMKNPCRI